MPRGQIIARSAGSWLVRFYRGRDPENGKRRYINKTVHGDRPAAEAELAGLAALAPARPEEKSKLNQYLDWWLYAAVAGRLRAKTAGDYRTLLDRYVRPALGEIRVDRLRPLALQSLLLNITPRGLSPRTVRYTHAVVRSALDQACRWKLLDKNPALDMPLPRADRRGFHALSREQAQHFASVCRNDPQALVFLVALSTGLRPSEYLALRVADFDSARSSLTITRTLERAHGKWTFAETKRPGSRRTVALPAEVAELVRARIGSGLKPDALIFQGPARGPIHERNLVQRCFKPLLKLADLPNLRLYDLRHSFAALALREGIPARLVSEQLGHASVAFTLDVYGHVLEETRWASAERLSQLLFPPNRKSAEHETANESDRKAIQSESAEPNQNLA
jgi:integrase